MIGDHLSMLWAYVVILHNKIWTICRLYARFFLVPCNIKIIIEIMAHISNGSSFTGPMGGIILMHTERTREKRGKAAKEGEKNSTLVRPK